MTLAKIREWKQAVIDARPLYHGHTMNSDAENLWFNLVEEVHRLETAAMEREMDAEKS